MGSSIFPVPDPFNDISPLMELVLPMDTMSPATFIISET